MQNTLLLVVALLIGLVIIVAYFANKRLSKRRENERPSVSIDEIHREHFAELDRSMFGDAWKGLAGAFEIAPEKLRPEDTISDFLKGRHMPEPYMEGIEDYLQKHRVEPTKVGVDTTVKAIVKELAKR